MTNTWANCEALFDFQPDVKVRGCGKTMPHDSGLISETRRWRPVCTHIPHIVRGEKMTAWEKGTGWKCRRSSQSWRSHFFRPGLFRNGRAWILLIVFKITASAFGVAWNVGKQRENQSQAMCGLLACSVLQKDKHPVVEIIYSCFTYMFTPSFFAEIHLIGSRHMILQPMLLTFTCQWGMQVDCIPFVFSFCFLKETKLQRAQTCSWVQLPIQLPPVGFMK